MTEINNERAQSEQFPEKKMRTNGSRTAVMGKHVPVPCVFMNLCMICDGSKVLMLDKVKGSVTGLTFPGGHVERDEPFADAVVREVFEETGLTLIEPKLCGTYDWIKEDVRYVGLLYRADKFTGTLTSSDEGEVFWVEYDEMLKMPLMSDLRELLEIFCGRGYSEFFCTPIGDGWNKWLK